MKQFAGRVAVAMAASLMAAGAGATDLEQVYRDALSYDAGLAGARASLEAGREKLPQGRAGLLPSLNLTGNSNWNEFYDWRGPDGRIRLHAFRVDSPMKGRFSANDESRLSFHVATVDLATMTMTVRECLWNQGPDPLWGAVRTVTLTR